MGTTNLGETSVLVAEATTIRNGVCAAIETGYRSLVLEGDNEVLIKALRGEVQIPWVIKL